MKVTIERDNGQLLGITFSDVLDEGVTHRYAVRCGKILVAFDHVMADGEMALVERAIGKLRRAGLK